MTFGVSFLPSLSGVQSLVQVLFIRNAFGPRAQGLILFPRIFENGGDHALTRVLIVRVVLRGALV